MGSESPVCVECVFADTMCPACSEVLDAVRLLNDASSYRETTCTQTAQTSIELLCSCGREEEICERCFRLVVHIRGLVPAATAQKIGPAVSHNQTGCILDAVARQDDLSYDTSALSS